MIWPVGLGCGIEKRMRRTAGDKAREFYEKAYPRDDAIASAPEDGDFMYGLVLGQMRSYLKPGILALDLGCNTGNLSLYMAQAGCEVTGIDIAQNAVETAKRSAARLGIRNVRFRRMDFIGDWRRAGVFDFVLCNHVIEHVPEDDALLERIHFSMKPGGRLLLCAPTLRSSLYRVHKWLVGRFAFDDEVGHLRRYDEQTFTGLVERAGFKVEKTVLLDSFLREWCIIWKPLRWTCRIWGRRFVRSIFNATDKLLARFLFPATICVHARRLDVKL